VPHDSQARPAPAGGPGTELKALLASLGILTRPGCSCNAYADIMDRWGVTESRRRRAEVVGWLKAEAGRRGWLAKARAAAAAVATGLAFRLDALDPFGSAVDEAIRRAEAKQGGAA
jgi:hypothetical protein